MIINLNYQKRKNKDLFESLEQEDNLFLSDIQNYIPIYNRFFALNTSNFNNINLNHNWYISKLIQKIDENNYECNIKNIETNKIKLKSIFFKMAPLLDPYKYLVGKYNLHNSLFKLPLLENADETIHEKMLDINNSAYIDGLFIFLTGELLHQYRFIHGIEYYGSFLSIKNNFLINVSDDLEYLVKSPFFIQNKNILFKIDDYEIDSNDEKLPPINIDYKCNKTISIKSINENEFEDIFEDCKEEGNQDDKQEEWNELKEYNINLNIINDSKANSLKTNSTCSSRSSYTSNNSFCQDKYNIFDDSDDNLDINNENIEINSEENLSQCEDDYETINTDMSSVEEECINVTIPKFPIQLICMEKCEYTLDELISNNELTTEEWFSILMQIIMMLITYQKVFNFTHNDLHTNNVMFNNTDKKYIYYCYKKTYYKVPTFGRIFKIIDFGRSIYKIKGQIFCSDSFNQSGDAVTQYNTEPYFNIKKPRLEPNYSFDLCRLACSIFDYIIDDLDILKSPLETTPVIKIINEWCLDDKGNNVLYKNNGDERYPDFKLYKMIARCVHNHTPQAQLERNEIKNYIILDKDIKNNEKQLKIINIDNIQSFI